MRRIKRYVAVAFSVISMSLIVTSRRTKRYVTVAFSIISMSLIVTSTTDDRNVNVVSELLCFGSAVCNKNDVSLEAKGRITLAIEVLLRSQQAIV